MKWAFEEWRHWLEGAKHRVVVLTDHKNLIYLESAKRLNPRQARWSLFFSRFDFVVSYLPGSKNVKADALSRSFSPDSPGVLEPVGILKEGVILSAISPDLRRVLQEFQSDRPDRCPVGKLFVPDRWTSKKMSVIWVVCDRFSKMVHLVEPSDCPGVNSVVDRLQQIWTHVVDNLTLSQERAQRFANRRRCVGPRLRVGDLVWLSSRHVPMKVSSPKFKPRFIGPYKISEIINPVSFRLALPASFAIYDVFHRSLLRRYVVPVVPSVDPPAPELVEGELEYEVEKILDSRFSRRRLQYLVKWKGYGQEDNSWVVASDVHATDLVRAFHLARPDRPGGSAGLLVVESRCVDVTQDEEAVTISPHVSCDYTSNLLVIELRCVDVTQDGEAVIISPHVSSDYTRNPLVIESRSADVTKDGKAVTISPHYSNDYTCNLFVEIPPPLGCFFLDNRQKMVPMWVPSSSIWPVGEDSKTEVFSSQFFPDLVELLFSTLCSSDFSCVQYSGTFQLPESSSLDIGQKVYPVSVPSASMWPAGEDFKTSLLPENLSLDIGQKMYPVSVPSASKWLAGEDIKPVASKSLLLVYPEEMVQSIEEANPIGYKETLLSEISDEANPVGHKETLSSEIPGDPFALSYSKDVMTWTACFRLCSGFYAGKILNKTTREVTGKSPAVFLRVLLIVATCCVLKKLAAAARKSEVIRMKSKFPTKVPVIVERYKKEKYLPLLDKTKFLVPRDLPMFEFLNVLRYAYLVKL
ncbi:unnamed protein product [Ranitomeya imitator]|uniref:Chromo domain-containing protein n=1 Tax=Ranitomeya imitator TaxID=111125 RepID=A0ABN9MIG3_9NEOB|nr:unnamed protein product [Ranitomeya imitator]